MAESAVQICRYPGCERPSRSDAGPGRPAGYCEESDGEGSPVHNRANAWRARQAQKASAAVVEVDEQLVSAPVSMARASLEQQLAELPSKMSEFRDYMDKLLGAVQAAGDTEAAGAEVADAHREALAKVTEAERQQATAERAARLAEERARVAERDRDEADAAAEEALAEAARVREESAAELSRIREEADTAIAKARDDLAAATSAQAVELAEQEALVARAEAEAEAARQQSAAAIAAKDSADEALSRELEITSQLRAELDALRQQNLRDREQMQMRTEAAELARQQASDELGAVRLELASAQADAASSRRDAGRDREAAESARRDLDAARAEMRTEREALRAAHAEQLAQAERSADQRVDALRLALEALRSQATSDAPARQRGRRAPDASL